MRMWARQLGEISGSDSNCRAGAAQTSAACTASGRHPRDPAGQTLVDRLVQRKDNTKRKTRSPASCIGRRFDARTTRVIPAPPGRGDPSSTSLNASARPYSSCSCGRMIASDLRTTGSPASTQDADGTRVRSVNRPGNPS
jgi:hypothetical protein